MLRKKSEDIAGFRSYLRLAVEFLNGREKLKRLKLKEHKHLIGTVFPAVEPVFAAGAVPVMPIRMQRFGSESGLLSPHNIIRLLDAASGAFGWSTIVSTITMLQRMDKSDFIGTMISKTIEAINEQYNRMYEIADAYGVPSDSCYGIRAVYGMTLEKGKNLSAFFNYPVRCSGFQKMYESFKKYVPKGIWMEIPYRKTPKAMEMLIEDLHAACNELEQITGTPITESRFKRICEITNECKTYARKILYEVGLSGRYPCIPVTFSETQALIELGFEDYLSDAENFLDILREMYYEMQSRRLSPEYGIDVSDRPKILLFPRFGGAEPKAHEFVHEQGGRLIYADWEILGYWKHIKTTGDIFENYAEYMLDTMFGFGITTKENAESIANFCIENGIDAVLYNQLFGCHSLTTSFRDLKNILRKHDIPVTLLSFNKIGENLGQVKTRIEALMELVR